MQTFGLASSKGGAGKSTLVTNLVVGVWQSGIPTALIDAEPRGPTARLLGEVVPEIATSVVTQREEIAREADRFRQEGRVVFLDAPGKTGEQMNTICRISDLVIVPIMICERDLIQSTDALALIRSFQISQEGRPEATILLNGTVHNDATADQFRKALEPIGISVAKKQIRFLNKYKRNTTVMLDPKLDREGAATDIREVIDELIMPRLTAATGRRVANDS